MTATTVFTDAGANASFMIPGAYCTPQDDFHGSQELLDFSGLEIEYLRDDKIAEKSDIRFQKYDCLLYTSNTIWNK